MDEILARLENPSIEAGFQDLRHCLVFWARPPENVRKLITEVQRRLRAPLPSLWTTPALCLHMTTLEVAHSLTAGEIDMLVDQMIPQAGGITDYTYTHRARLIKPLVSYDALALALSFVPAANEQDAYTYHHLRRDVFGKASATGVKIASHYLTPSAHLTIARFVTASDLETAPGQLDGCKVQQWIDTTDDINRWLQEEYWPKEGGIKEGGEWVVGEEKGLELRKGPVWYGGGEQVHLGKGF